MDFVINWITGSPQYTKEKAKKKKPNCEYFDLPYYNLGARMKIDKKLPLRR